MTRAEEIVAASAKAFGIRGPDVLGKSKSNTIAHARQACAWIMRTHTRMSFPEIARAIGYADHSSAMSAHKEACAKMETDDLFTRRLHDAESDLGLVRA
jgi:chromosomal replication initiation ATPase DnaA